MDIARCKLCGRIPESIIYTVETEEQKCDTCATLIKLGIVDEDGNKLPWPYAERAGHANTAFGLNRIGSAR